MATGRHWEWRGFGKVSEDFRTRFNSYPLKYPDSAEWGEVKDEYLWVPGCDINVKLRRGIEDGLKFKRLERTEEGIELWFENPDELYPYAELNANVLKKLGDALNVRLPTIPDGPFDRENTLDLLQNANPRPKVVEIHKRRQTRVWKNSESKVLVEIAEISQPKTKTILSVGLENDTDLQSDASAEQVATAKDSIVAAKKFLRINQESLKSMSYLKALEIWASGGSL